MRTLTLTLAALLSLTHIADCQAPAGQPRRTIPSVKRLPSALLGRVTEGADMRAVPYAKVRLEPKEGAALTVTTDADGIFRIGGLAPGTYKLSLLRENASPSQPQTVVVNPNELLAVELRLASPSSPNPVKGSAEEAEADIYKEIFRRPAVEEPSITDVIPEDKVAVTQPDRWESPMPEWSRYDRPGEFPYVRGGRWFDPFNQNRIKGDKPLFGKTFFNFTGTSASAVDIRRLPIPSGVASSRPGSKEFFGHGQQSFLAETARFSFDLFHGDTSFRPVDWRIRITPAVNINQIWTRERGILNRDVRKGTDRTDAHLGLQEAFVEYKVRDLSPNFDFVSVRAGIQQFNSDFRGFIFTQEQPGVRIFGNLRSNRYQYNAAYFYFLEKDTNSGLNKFEKRDQQVLIANLYIQDFLTHGYTTQFSYHYNKDDATVHYDDNHFLVRPAAIGALTPHDIRSHYIGWTGNGHVGRLNISHAAYQVLGFDRLNPVSGRRNDINAQMGALEVSYDRDWIRYRGSAFFASGDKNPRDRIARGFDSIGEAQSFAGGIFSFFNREGIPLTGTSVPLTSPDSFLPNLRSSKDEGQANYVNPGLMLLNAGIDVDITPKLRGFLNVNGMRFHHTEPLEYLLFQSKIRSSIGVDYGVGASYRPPLSDNIVITGGITALTPGAGLRQIYTAKTLVSAFTLVKFQF